MPNIFGQQNFYDSLLVGDEYRSFLVHLPNSNENLPVVLNFHGLGSTPEEQQAYTRLDTLADKEEFIVIYPKAVLPFFIWETKDLPFIEMLIDSLYKLYKVDVSRIYVTGFSSGGFISNYVGCKIPNKVAAIAPVAGGFIPIQYPDIPKKGMPVFMINNEYDMSVTYYVCRFALDRWRGWNQTDITPIKYTPSLEHNVYAEQYKNGRDNSEVILYTVTDRSEYSHYWPNTKKGGIETNKEIWSFFQKHSLDITGIAEENEILEKFKLFDNYPNPFNPSTTIKFELAQLCNVKIEIINLLGQKVRTLANSQLSAGVHSVLWNGKNDLNESVVSGIYFYRLISNRFSLTKKMMLIK